MQQILNAHTLRSLKTSQGMSLKTPTTKRPQAHTKKVHSMTNQSTTQPTEKEKELQAISNAAYDKAIDNGCSEEEAEAISNEAYDNAEEKKETKHTTTERSVFSALIYWKDDEDGIEQWGTEVLIALYDDDEECEDTFWHHQGTEESFFVDFAKDNKRNQEDFYAEKID